MKYLYSDYGHLRFPVECGHNTLLQVFFFKARRIFERVNKKLGGYLEGFVERPIRHMWQMILIQITSLIG